MKTYLITGAGGLICSAIVGELLKREDAVVYAAGRRIEKMRLRLGEHPHLHFVEYDAMRPLAFDFHVDCIIHGAGVTSPEQYVSAPVSTIWTNVFGIRELLEYAKRGGAEKVVYISSSEVYGNATPRINGFLETDYGFVDILSPRSSYPVAKSAAEALCAGYVAEAGMNVSIARPGHIYGPTCSPDDRRVSSAFAWQAARGEDLVLKSSGMSLRSYTHGSDCARGILTICEKGKPGEAYNIANRKGMCTIRRMAEIMAAAGGVELKMDFASDADKVKFNPMNNSCLDPTKLESLGWKGEIAPEYGFSDTVRILREKL